MTDPRALAGIGSGPALAVALILTGAGLVTQLSFWIATRYPEAKKG